MKEEGKKIVYTQIWKKKIERIGAYTNWSEIYLQYTDSRKNRKLYASEA